MRWYDTPNECLALRYALHITHQVIFKSSDGVVIMPGIHEVLSASTPGALQVDIHPHDLYYNHYRCKSHQVRRRHSARACVLACVFCVLCFVSGGGLCVGMNRRVHSSYFGGGHARS